MATRQPRRETEQPAGEARQQAAAPELHVTESMLLRQRGWFPPKWELADASAIKALMAGTANGEQQRRAMKWILETACALPDWAYRPHSSDDTHIMLGRQFVGHQIMKLAKVNLAAVRRREPNSDPHEPQS